MTELIRRQLPYDSFELILDYIHGTVDHCREEHKKKHKLENIDAISNLLVFRIRNTFRYALVSAKIGRRNVDPRSPDVCGINILYLFEWSIPDIFPKTILIMARYGIQFETWLYFNRHRPLMFDGREDAWFYYRLDCVRHERDNIGELLFDIQMEAYHRFTDTGDKSPIVDPFDSW